MKVMNQTKLNIYGFRNSSIVDIFHKRKIEIYSFKVGLFLVMDKDEFQRRAERCKYIMNENYKSIKSN